MASIWIKWNVAPIARKLCMTTSKGAEGQIQMFSELARDGVSSDETNGSEGKQIATEVGSKVVVSEGLQQMGAIAESIYNGKTKEDKDNFVEFFVIPLAKELGMTTSMSKEGQKRMFSEIASVVVEGPCESDGNEGVVTILASSE